MDEMTREEEIKRASVHHLDQYDYSYEEGEHLDFYIKGFTEGAKWADEHPINVWHSTNEEPMLNQWFLAQIGDNAFDTFIMAMNKNKDWREWSKGINIKRWAYVADVLPKGGAK